MNRETFTSLVKLADHGELEKAALVAFYLHAQGKQEEFTAKTLADAMIDFGLSKPNVPRLKGNMTGSAKPFVKGRAKDTYKLSLKKSTELAATFSSVMVQSEEIVTDETILPDSLLKGTRGYLVKVGQQINASFHYKIYDGCTMLMRRMLEMLLILVYQHAGREAEIQDAGGGYQPLSHIINHAQSNGIIRLTRASNDVIDGFRQLGNYSAHGLTFLARRSEIDKIKIPFRACVEELLHVAGIIT